MREKIEQEKTARHDIKISIFNCIRKDISEAKQLADSEIEKTKQRRLLDEQKHFVGPLLTSLNNSRSNNNNSHDEDVLEMAHTEPNNSNMTSSKVLRLPKIRNNAGQNHCIKSVKFNDNVKELQAKEVNY